MSGGIAFIISCFDKFSGPAMDVERSMKKLDHAASAATKRFAWMAVGLKQMSRIMEEKVTDPIKDFAKESVAAFDESANAIARMNILLKNTQNAAGFTSQQLMKMDQALSDNSLYTRTEILSQVTNGLLKFKGISGKTFVEAQQDIVDYAAFSGKSLKGVAKLFGTALADPEKGMDRLRIAGIIFTKQQRKVITTLEETGRIEKARQLMTKDWAKIYEGMALSAQKTGAGPLKNLNKQFEEIKEKVGEQLNPILIKLNGYMLDILKRFNSLSPSQQNMIIKFVLLAAAIGPVLGYLAVFFVILSSLEGVFVVLLSPITLVVAAVVALGVAGYEAYKHFLPFKHLIDGIADSFKSVGTHIGNFAYDMLNKPIDVNHTVMGHGSGLPPSQFLAGTQHASKADITVNVNDPTGVIKSVNTVKSGNANVNVGRNMSHVG